MNFEKQLLKAFKPVLSKKEEEMLNKMKQKVLSEAQKKAMKLAEERQEKAIKESTELIVKELKRSAIVNKSNYVSALYTRLAKGSDERQDKKKKVNETIDLYNKLEKENNDVI